MLIDNIPNTIVIPNTFEVAIAIILIAYVWTLVWILYTRYITNRNTNSDKVEK